MMNFGLLATEIVSLVWGTPANFNGFRVLAALLHVTLVVAVSETAVLNRERHLYIFGTAAITLGIGPHSSFLAFEAWVASFWLRLDFWSRSKELKNHCRTYKLSHIVPCSPVTKQFLMQY